MQLGIGVLIGLAAGVAIGVLGIRLFLARRVTRAAEEQKREAEEARRAAEAIRREAQVEAKEQGLKLRAEVEQELPRTALLVQGVGLARSHQVQRRWGRRRGSRSAWY